MAQSSASLCLSYVIEYAHRGLKCYLILRPSKSVSIGTRDRIFLPKTCPVLRTFVYQTLHERSWRRPLFHCHSLCYSSGWISLLSFHHSHFCVLLIKHKIVLDSTILSIEILTRNRKKKKFKILKGKKEEQGCLLFLGLFFQGWNIPHTVPEARSPKPRWQKANYSLVSSSFWWLQAFLGLWGHPSNLYLHLKWSSWPVPLYVLLFLIRALNGFRIRPHAIWAHLHIYVNYICRDPLCKPGSGWTCILGRGTDSTHHSYRVSSRQDTPSLCLCIQPAPLWAFLSLTGSTQ